MKNDKFEDMALAYIVDGRLYDESELKDVANAKKVTVSDDIGMRVYRDTLCFLFEVAVNNIFKFKKNLRITSSIGDGYYYIFKEKYIPTQKDIDEISKEMTRIVKSNEKVAKIEMNTAEAIEVLKKCNMDWSVTLAESLNESHVFLNKYNDTYKLDTTFISNDFSTIRVFELRKYNDGFLLRFPRRGNKDVLDDWKDNKILYDVISENIHESDVLSIDSIGMLNNLVARNGLSEYIEVSENLQRRRIIEIADKVKHKGKVKAVFVAGPSSSNKTTFANRLCIELKVLGYQPVQISLDNYYFTKDKVPRDEFGEPDVECLESIDVELFKNNLKDLYEGKEVYLPHFEFNYNKIGRRTFSPTPIKLEKNDILVIEGIHALNTKLTENIDKSAVFKIYISPLIQLNLDEYDRVRSTDIRILRRIVRDFRCRNASAQETLSMWSSVEKGERKYIFPYQNDTDAIMNSAHSYEIGVLAVLATPLLRSIKPEDSLQSFITARRLLKILSKVNPISPLLVPQTSMLHEFIG